MSNNELEILLTLRDKATAQLKKFRASTKSAVEAMKKNWLALTVAIAAVIVVIKKATESMLNMTKELIRVNAKVESFRTRIIAVTDSLEEGNKIFKDMAELAGKVPKTYEEIMESATNLTAVVKGGAKEVKQLMPIIVDIASVTGISVIDTTSQIIRMYSAGAAAAEMFKERGIAEALGFKAGVAITNKETMDILIKQWEDGTGKYVGGAQKMAKTWDGLTSMMQDSWFNFKKDIGAKVFDNAKVTVTTILEVIKKSKEEGGKYSKVVEKLGEAFSDMFDSAVDSAGKLFVAFGQTIDILSEMKVAMLGIKGAWLEFISLIFEASIGLQNINNIISFNRGFTFVDVDANRAAIEEIKNDVLAVTEEIRLARDQADVDYSTKFKVVMGEIMNTYNELKVLVIKNQKEMDKAGIDGAKVTKKLSDQQLKQVEALTKSTEKAFESAISGMIQGTTTAKEAFAALGQKMIQILADFIAEQIVTFALSKAIAWIMTKFVTATATVIANAWAPAAALASLATLGGNAAPAALAMGATVALSKGIANVNVGEASATPMATGGIVTRPTNALIGEAGPEAVIPLNKSGMFGNISIEINVNEPQIRDAEDITLLSESISGNISEEIERLQ